METFYSAVYQADSFCLCCCLCVIWGAAANSVDDECPRASGSGAVRCGRNGWAVSSGEALVLTLALVVLLPPARSVRLVGLALIRVAWQSAPDWRTTVASSLSWLPAAGSGLRPDCDYGTVLPLDGLALLPRDTACTYP